MSLTTLIGFIAAISVFLVTVILSISETAVLLDFKAGLMVVGGTIAAALIILPFKHFLALFKIFFQRMFGKRGIDYYLLIEEVVRLATANYKSKDDYEEELNKITFPFLKESGEVLFWIESEVTADELRDLLETRISTHFQSYMKEADSFLTISKFPPAFGLMGTTIGMVGLLQTLGDKANGIGQSMSVALITTLYGLALSNFIFIPVAENLIKQTQEDNTARKLIVESLMLIQAKRHPKYVEEMAKSFVLPSLRSDSKKEQA